MDDTNKKVEELEDFFGSVNSEETTNETKNENTNTNETTNEATNNKENKNETKNENTNTNETTNEATNNKENKNETKNENTNTNEATNEATNDIKNKFDISFLNISEENAKKLKEEYSEISLEDKKERIKKIFAKCDTLIEELNKKREKFEVLNKKNNEYDFIKLEKNFLAGWILSKKIIENEDNPEFNLEKEKEKLKNLNFDTLFENVIEIVKEKTREETYDSCLFFLEKQIFPFLEYENTFFDELIEEKTENKVDKIKSDIDLEIFKELMEILKQPNEVEKYKKETKVVMELTKVLNKKFTKEELISMLNFEGKEQIEKLVKEFNVDKDPKTAFNNAMDEYIREQTAIILEPLLSLEEENEQILSNNKIDFFLEIAEKKVNQYQNEKQNEKLSKIGFQAIEEEKTIEILASKSHFHGQEITALFKNIEYNQEKKYEYFFPINIETQDAKTVLSEFNHHINKVTSIPEDKEIVLNFGNAKVELELSNDKKGKKLDFNFIFEDQNTTPEECLEIIKKTKKQLELYNRNDIKVNYNTESKYYDLTLEVYKNEKEEINGKMFFSNYAKKRKEIRKEFIADFKKFVSSNVKYFFRSLSGNTKEVSEKEVASNSNENENKKTNTNSNSQTL